MPSVLPRANPAAAREESEGGLTANMEMLSRTDSTEQQEENVIHGTTGLIVDEKIEEIILSYFSHFGEIVWFQGHENLSSQESC